MFYLQGVYMPLSVQMLVYGDIIMNIGWHETKIGARIIAERGGKITLIEYDYTIM